MNEEEKKILKSLKELSRDLPRFPDGRVDYSNSETAFVVTVFVKCEDKILLLKRSDKVGVYQGKWNCVSGYLDDMKPLREKAFEEFNEELGIDKKDILSINIGGVYKLTDRKINKIYIVHTVLVKLKNRPIIELDFEHTEYKWIKPEELKEFDIVPDLDKGLECVMHLI